MISTLGRLLVLVSLAACSVGAVSGLAGGKKKSSQAWKWARIASYIAFGAVTLALLLMEYALYTNDFSVSYVVKVGSLDTPRWVSIVSLWSSLEGSILLWAFVLNGYIAGLAYFTKDRYKEYSSYAIGMALIIGVFFSFLVAGVANPFTPTELPIPKDGLGPNALLQNHVLIIIHPPALYLGYVGMAVPFAMGCAALFAGKIGADWSAALRKWMLLPWGSLTAGIILGGWWSYEVLGWGGYWAWDPVENASFLPWLTSTAFLHSALLVERKGKLKGWALVLLLLSFLLTLLGTFMTRSGVFNSVHAFTKSPIGPVFLSFLALSTLFSLGLLASRIDVLVPKKENASDTNPVSRDSAVLLNNLVFAAFSFTVLIGTVYPLIHEATSGKKLSIGEPYFNEIGIPLSIAIVFLMGVGPALPWGKIPFSAAMKRLAQPVIMAFAVVGISVALGAEGFLPLFSFGISGFALHTTLREFWEPAQLRSQKKNEPILSALWQTMKRTRRRTGGYIVHLGVIMMAMAVTASGSFKQQTEVHLQQNETVQVDDYDLTYLEPAVIKESHRQSRMARIQVSKNGSEIGILEPKLNHYFKMGSDIGTPAVRSSLKEDLYLNMVNISSDGSSVSLQVIIEPMIFWIWFGGGIMCLGSLISAWPASRKKKAEAMEKVG